MNNNRHFLKQTFQEQTLPKVNEQSVSRILLTSKSLSFLIVIFLDNIWNFWDQKHSRNFYNQICIAHTKKSFITHSIAMFLFNVGVFLFCINHTRNPPETTKNLTEQIEKLIKTHCKPCKNRLWYKKQSKIKTIKEILENCRALQVLVFFFKQNYQKTCSTVELKKREMFRICPDI